MKEIKSQNLSEELKELYDNKFNIEDKLLALKEKWMDNKSKFSAF